LVLVTQLKYIVCPAAVAAGREGAKEASAPGDTVPGAAFGGANVWNSEIWPIILAN